MTTLMVKSCHITLRTPCLEMTLRSFDVFHMYRPDMMNSNRRQGQLTGRGTSMRKRGRVHHWGLNQTTTGAGLWTTLTSLGLFEGNSRTLDAEEGHLDVFDVEVPPSICWVVGIPAPVDDGRNSVEHARVDNNHPLDSAKDAWVC